jgi:glucose-6-phosphate isomerase
MTDSDAWAEVARQAARPDAAAIRARFAADPERPARFTRSAAGITLDLSRTSLDEAIFASLLALARARGVAARLAAMARGEAVNATERRAALHMALRAPRAAGFRTGEEDASAEVHATLDAMRRFAAAVHAGEIRAASGARFTDVLNIGIGGSDLGPAMVCRALARPGQPMRAKFLSNVDGHAWAALAPSLDPDTTLVLVASKTFTTAETMANAHLVKAWLGERAGAQMAAMSTNLAATSAFGIPPERVFGFRDWVGGRFSLWSAIGLSIALACGWDAFAGLLAGARAMDEHALSAADADNLPLLLALVEVWHVNGLRYPARAVLPYDERLARLPAHLQQLEMESLGKRVTEQGAPVARATGPVVFGEPGTNAQHSFLQLLHQGTTPIPADIILVAAPDHPHAGSHRALLANGLAQAAALMRGRSAEEARAEMLVRGMPAAEAERVAPHRAFPGDRPSTLITLPRLDAFHLGALIALYEHKVACLGALWGVDAFDQWGVELGKQLAGEIAPALSGAAPAPDAATAATIATLRRHWPAL